MAAVLIRTKVILVVLPLIVTPLLLLGIASFYAARAGITGVATDLLAYKSEELAGYAESQWAVLEQNGLSGTQAFVELSKAAIGQFARGMVRSPTELFLAVRPDGSVAFATSEVSLQAGEQEALAALARDRASGWRELRIGGVERVAQAAWVDPYEWEVLVSESRPAFYRAADQILSQGAVILAVAAGAAVLLLLAFSGYLARPLRLVVQAMRGVIASNDLSRRVELLYRDETGELAHTFNLMTGELEQAYGQIKSYALESAIARTREQKIRNIFQRYVPKEVIDTFFQNPESMLVGENRVLAILFSDIRGFTTISERMKPEEVVASLNAYFGLMVDLITTRRGIVDKYIGDAIMAFYGAPVRHGDDAWQAVESAFDMLEGLVRFNAGQRGHGRPEFRIGIGINYGLVTVGNIGSEKKMDYTVIGDMVNLAQRLEELTKFYKEPLVFSGSVHRAVRERAPCRRLDRVAVRGKSQAVELWTARRGLEGAERDAWSLHEEGFGLYLKRDFPAAAARFSEVQRLARDDEPSRILLERCKRLERNPPPENWTGAVAISAK